MIPKISLSFAIIAFFILLSKTVYSQEEYMIKAVYNLTFKADSTNLADVRDEPMILFIGQASSKFMSYNAFKRDSVNQSLSQDRKANIASGSGNFSDHMANLRRVAPPSRFNFIIYKEFEEGSITVYDRVFFDPFVYPEDTPPIWSMTEHTDTIFGYRCQKATTLFGGREWIVWFSPDIPFPAGPYKFAGLPGLILKAEDSRSHYIFEIQSIIPHETKHRYPPYSNAIPTTKKGFFQSESYFRDNIINYAADAQMDNFTQQRAAENMRRRNNPIELKAE